MKTLYGIIIRDANGTHPRVHSAYDYEDVAETFRSIGFPSGTTELEGEHGEKITGVVSVEPFLYFPGRPENGPGGKQKAVSQHDNDTRKSTEPTKTITRASRPRQRVYSRC